MRMLANNSKPSILTMNYELFCAEIPVRFENVLYPIWKRYLFKSLMENFHNYAIFPISVLYRKRIPFLISILHRLRMLISK